MNDDEVGGDCREYGSTVAVVLYVLIHNLECVLVVVAARVVQHIPVHRIYIVSNNHPHTIEIFSRFRSATRFNLVSICPNSGSRFSVQRHTDIIIDSELI